MPTFILTARRDINFHDINNSLKQIKRGDVFEITINASGINTTNLFNNSRIMDSLQRQFQQKDVYLPKSSYLLQNSGPWDIKMR